MFSSLNILSIFHGFQGDWNSLEAQVDESSPKILLLYIYNSTNICAWFGSIMHIFSKNYSLVKMKNKDKEFMEKLVSYFRPFQKIDSTKYIMQLNALGPE